MHNYYWWFQHCIIATLTLKDFTAFEGQIVTDFLIFQYILAAIWHDHHKPQK